MNRFRSAAVSKTSRSTSQRSGLLRLVPLYPAHSRAPGANRPMAPMHDSGTIETLYESLTGTETMALNEPANYLREAMSITNRYLTSLLSKRS